MKNKFEAMETVFEHASPFIPLSFVVDEKGKVLFHFDFHPQTDEVMISLGGDGDVVSIDDVRGLAEKMLEFCEVAEVIVNDWHLKNNSNL